MIAIPGTSFRSPPCLAGSHQEPCAAGIFIRLLPTRNRKFLEAYASSEVGKETGPGAESLLAAWGFDLGGVTLWSDHLVLSDAQRAWGGSKAHQPVCVWWGAGGRPSALEPDSPGSSLGPAASWLCDPGSVTKPPCFLICKEGSGMRTGVISWGGGPERMD